MRSWLIVIRKNTKMTQAQVAEKSLVSRGYYANIENGKYKVPTLTAKKIAKALGFDWIRFYEDEPSDKAS